MAGLVRPADRDLPYMAARTTSVPASVSVQENQQACLDEMVIG